ncbi:MAG: hypothetical protein HKL95_08080, partial [Phycisphaerae bacterium]|nr:hypothetical protein [Phycisphaerae bacterium]
MDSVPVMKVEAYVERMRGITEELLRGVATAVNKAPNGAWINGSEMEVRDLLGDFRRKAYETALQMRIDAAQAAFSPGGCKDGQTPA